MAKVKVFVYGRQQHKGYDNSSPDFRHRELKSFYESDIWTVWSWGGGGEFG